MRIQGRIQLSNQSLSSPSQDTVKRHLVKRYLESDSSSNGLNSLLVIIALVVAIPLLIFLATKFKIFGVCSDSYESNGYKRRNKRKRRYRNSRSRVNWYISPEDDESEESDYYNSREYEKQRYRKKSSKNRLTKKRKSRNKDLEVKPEDNESSHGSVQSKKSQAKSLTSINSTYRYCVYNPDLNRMAMSRSVDDLQSAIPSDTAVLYKVDDHDEVEKFENQKSNVLDGMVPSVNRNRSVYYIVNSDLLLSQLRQQSSVDNRSQEFKSENKVTKNSLSNSDLNQEKHTSDTSKRNSAQVETSETDSMPESASLHKSLHGKNKKIRRSSSRVRIVEPIDSERYSRRSRDKRSHRLRRGSASMTSKSKKQRSRRSHRSSRHYRSRRRSSHNY